MKINFNVDTAKVPEWADLYRQVSSGLKGFCHEFGKTPVPVIDAYQALDRMGQTGFYQFGPFLEQTGLPLAYERTRAMLEDEVAENEELARLKISSARDHFPSIRVTGLSRKEETSPDGSTIHKFFTEQSQIELLLEQYGSK